MKGEEENGADRVRVAVRVRPLVQHERLKNARECISYFPQNNQVILGKERAFTFDYLFPPSTEQESIYTAIGRPLVDGCFQGYNATILAYGQTGAGKTFTMGTNIHAQTSARDVGIIPRVIDDIFFRLRDKQNVDITVKVAFVELYNEEVRDLLHPTEKSSISIRENEQGDIILAGVREEATRSAEEMRRYLEAGMLRRTTGTTGMNDQSSRSHAIFTISIEQRVKEPEGPNEPDFMFAKLHLVDLAGSERNKRTGAQGIRFKESIQINSGLLALGNVISALSEGKSFVPYRDSKLTRMLQDSLGGNSRTLMVACVSPADNSFDETLNTLRYANRAKNIRNKPIVNRDPAAAQIATLKNELQSIQAELGKYKELFHPIPHNIDHVLQKTTLKTVIADYLSSNPPDSAPVTTSSTRNSIETLSIGKSAQLNNTQLDQAKTMMNDFVETMRLVIAQSRTSKTVQIDGQEYVILKLLRDQFARLSELISNAEIFLQIDSARSLERPTTGKAQPQKEPSKAFSSPPPTAPHHVKSQNYISTDAERPRTVGSIKKAETDPRSLMQLQLTTIKELEDELAATKAELQATKKQLHGAQEDLRRDEEIFSGKLIELRDSEAQNRAFEREINELREKIEQMNQKSLMSTPIASPHKMPRSPSVEVEIQTSRILRSRSSSRGDSSNRMSLAESDYEESFPVMEEIMSEKDMDELQRILEEKRRVEEEKVQLEHKLHNQIEQHQQNISKMESYMRELATNIKMKEELIKELVRNEKEAKQLKVQYETRLYRLETELQRVREEYDKLGIPQEGEAPMTERRVTEVQQMRKKYELKLGNLQAELASVQKQQSENEKVYKITSQSDRKIHQLQEELDKLRSQQDQLKRKMKEEYDRAQELQAAKTKEINQLRKVIEKNQKQIRELEKENQTQKIHLKKKSDEAMQAQRKFDSQQAELERQKVLLEREVQKHLEQKRANEILNAELQKRESIIKEREQYLFMRNSLEVKKLRSSQAIVENIHGMTKMIENAEKDIRDKERTLGSVKIGEPDRKALHTHITQIQSHRDELVRQRSYLQERLTQNQVLQKHEEEDLRELNERIEDLETEIEFKTQAIREAQKMVSSQEDWEIDIARLNPEEAKLLMKQYLDKILGLTDSYHNEKEKCQELEFRVSELESYVQDLQNSLQMRDVDYDRQMTTVQKEYEQRVQGLLRQIRSQENPDTKSAPEAKSGEQKADELSRELYYYKQSYKELKKKMKQMADPSVLEKLQSERDYLLERNTSLESEIKNLKDYLMRHQSAITTVRKSLKELRHVPADQIERKTHIHTDTENYIENDNEIDEQDRANHSQSHTREAESEKGSGRFPTHHRRFPMTNTAFGGNGNSKGNSTGNGSGIGRNPFEVDLIPAGDAFRGNRRGVDDDADDDDDGDDDDSPRRGM